MEPFDLWLKRLQEELRKPGRWLPDHPVLLKISRGELTRDQLRGWAAEICLSSLDFSHVYAAAYVNCPHPDARKLMFENIYEEEMGGVTGGGNHLEIKLDFCESLGLRREEVLARKPNRATEFFLVYRELMFRTRPWQVSAGAYGFSVESQIPETFALILEGLRTHYQLPKKGTQFFETHEVADKDHGELGRILMEKYCNSPELREQSFEAGLKFSERFYDFYGGGLQ